MFRARLSGCFPSNSQKRKTLQFHYWGNGSTPEGTGQQILDDHLFNTFHPAIANTSGQRPNLENFRAEIGWYGMEDECNCAVATLSSRLRISLALVSGTAGLVLCPDVTWLARLSLVSTVDLMSVIHAHKYTTLHRHAWEGFQHICTCITFTFSALKLAAAYSRKMAGGGRRRRP